MSYRFCTAEREIAASIWNVLASFGYTEAVISGDVKKDCFNKVTRLAVDDGSSYTALLAGEAGPKAMSELAAAAVEAALAIGFAEFSLEITCPEETGELLSLYGLEEWINVKRGDFEFYGISGGHKLFHAGSEDGILKCVFDLKECAGAETGLVNPSPSQIVVYAEKNGEGIAYEIAYTLRLSGCLVINYLGSGDIEACERSAAEDGAASIIRVFPDGKIQIKEMADGSVTETDYETFVGYYDDEEDDHDCGCGHDHDHDHEHGHDCGCGHVK
ncbi:MAG: hypothetical protein J6N52_10925 [Clostridia bacterium]|nr:hypothetical protein [Clostridia bacterium]